MCRKNLWNLSKYAGIVLWLNTICDIDCSMALSFVRVNVVTQSIYMIFIRFKSFC